jgi:hypothetical protein
MIYLLFYLFICFFIYLFIYFLIYSLIFYLCICFNLYFRLRALTNYEMSYIICRYLLFIHLISFLVCAIFRKVSFIWKIEFVIKTFLAAARVVSRENKSQTWKWGILWSKFTLLYFTFMFVAIFTQIENSMKLLLTIIIRIKSDQWTYTDGAILTEVIPPKNKWFKISR